MVSGASCTSADDAIFGGLERDQHWQLGILVGIVSTADEEPQTKELPAELKKMILDALKLA